VRRRQLAAANGGPYAHERVGVRREVERGQGRAEAAAQLLELRSVEGRLEHPHHGDRVALLANAVRGTSAAPGSFPTMPMIGVG
jgi:hypothetical protein